MQDSSLNITFDSLLQEVMVLRSSALTKLGRRLGFQEATHGEMLSMLCVTSRFFFLRIHRKDKYVYLNSAVCANN